MGEIINLQIGQCGARSGLRFWETLSSEHSISPDGYFLEKKQKSFRFEGKGGKEEEEQRDDGKEEEQEEQEEESEAKNEERSYVYFREGEGRGSSGERKYIPRSIFVDFESDVLESIKKDHPLLFQPDNFVWLTGQSSGSSWGASHYWNAPELEDQVLEQTRKEAEKCDSLQGFQFSLNLGGSTGSGCGSYLLSKLREEYSEKMMSIFAVFPYACSGRIMEPYEAVLGMHQLIENSDVVFCMGNEALYHICFRHLKMKSPAHSDLNEIIAQAMSGTTSTFRFGRRQSDAVVHSDMRKLVMNMVPHYRTHFLTLAHAPLIPRASLPHHSNEMTLKELTQQVFDPRNMLNVVNDHPSSLSSSSSSSSISSLPPRSSCSPSPYIGERKDHFLSAVINFRGASLSPFEVEKTVSDFQKQHQRTKKELSTTFVDWIPDNIKSSVCYSPLPSTSLFGSPPLSATLVANSTSIVNVFSVLSSQFSTLFRRKAFLHFYLSAGMEEMEFVEAQENLNDLVLDYDQYRECDSQPFVGAPPCL